MSCTRRELLLGVAIGVLLRRTGVASAVVVEDLYATAGRLVDEGSFEKAAELYQELLELEREAAPERRARILNNLGFCRFRLRKVSLAMRHYSEALQLSPAYATCLNNMGAALISEGRYAEALVFLDRGYRAGKSIKVVFNLFVAHYRLRHEREALTYIEEAFRLDSTYTEARLRAKNVKQSDIEKLRKRFR